MPVALSTQQIETVHGPWSIRDRQRRELHRIRATGGCSRSDLFRGLEIRKNTVSDDVQELLDAGLIRERPQPSRVISGTGRPQIPLEVDPEQRCVVGLSIDPGRVTCGRVDLLGRSLGKPRSATVRHAPGGALAEARRLLRAMLDDSVIGVGVTVPGFIEPASASVLFSSAWPDVGPVDLRPMLSACEGKSVFIESLTNGIALRWMLGHMDVEADEHLVVYLTDGRLGATLMHGGRPLPGCLAGSNELGHTRMPVRTPRCYCGQRGCLERIFSTEFLRQHKPDAPSLSEAIGLDRQPAALGRASRLLAMGLANAINFSRVGRMTIVTDLPGEGVPGYLDRLVGRIRRQLLRELAERVRIGVWIEDEPHPASTAGAVALADLFLPASVARPVDLALSSD